MSLVLGDKLRKNTEYNKLQWKKLVFKFFPFILHPNMWYFSICNPTIALMVGPHADNSELFYTTTIA